MIPQKDILIEDFNYELPEEKIAFFPVSQRDHSKLLVYQNGHITDACFADLPDFLTSDYRLIFNDSKVIHARLLVALGGEVVGNQLHGLLVSFVRKQITRFLAARERAGGKSH